MKRLSERSITGVDSATFNHYHAFISKLDNAAEQVQIAVRQAKALAEKRRTLWFKQRQKVQAVEHLIAIKLKKMVIKEQKAEQKMFDEIATQQFIRRTM